MGRSLNGLRPIQLRKASPPEIGVLASLGIHLANFTRELLRGYNLSANQASAYYAKKCIGR